MSIKYAPAHASWVGAPTKGNTVDAPHVYRHPLRAGEAQWRLAQYPYSGPLTTEGGREEDTKRERVRKHPSPALHSTLSSTKHWTTSLFIPLELNWAATADTLLLFFFCKTIHTCGGDALRENIFHYIRIPEAWRLTDMARGIESLVSLNPFCSMDSEQGGHNDNCKFWLLDLGRCLDHVFHMRNWIMCRAGWVFFPSLCLSFKVSLYIRPECADWINFSRSSGMAQWEKKYRNRNSTQVASCDSLGAVCSRRDEDKKQKRE